MAYQASTYRPTHSHQEYAVNKSLAIAISLILSIAVVGCSKDNGSAKKQPAAKNQAGKATPHAGARGAPAQANAGLGTGKVVETMNSGGYTYVKVAIGGGEVWAAGPETAVAVGDTVSLPEGAPMKGYHSKTLDRTFDMVYFVPAIGKGGASGTNAHGTASAGKPAAVAAKVEGIAKAEGGKTVAEIFASKAALGGKPVILRGKVVKYNAAIMGHNWLHIQDGSGAAGTNDLTITTNDKVAVGDTVLVRGTVVLDKDFGAGYKYDVLVEEASVTKE